jgi:opacity protein-like surface antigen
MKTLAAVLLGLTSAWAAADNQRGFYVGGGLSAIEFDDGSAFDNDLTFRTVELLGGYKYNSALGIELRAGTNWIKREVIQTVEGDGATHTLHRDFAIDHYESIYYRPELANEEAKLYGLLGYSQLKRSLDSYNISGGTFGSGESSDTESGLSYGVGIGFVINQDFNFNIEYRQLIDKQNYEITAASANVDYRF